MLVIFPLAPFFNSLLTEVVLLHFYCEFIFFAEKHLLPHVMLAAIRDIIIQIFLFHRIVLCFSEEMLDLKQRIQYSQLSTSWKFKWDDIKKYALLVLF